MDRWLLRGVNRVIVEGPAEAARCRQVGVAEDKLSHIPPGVQVTDGAVEETTNLSIEAADGTRFVACMGTLERHKGYRVAIWAFDILHFLYDDLHMLVIGDGPDRCRLEQFARNIRCREVVHFLGDRADGRALLPRADAVLVPDLAPGGVNVALEAMAAGLPVVASRLPELAEIIVDGQTGFLVPPGRPAELARQARLLVDDPELRLRMGEAGRKRVAEVFSVGELVRRMTLLYQEMMEDQGSKIEQKE
jgi:glycosyltransferase involved in cell wall biosynthesis